CARCGYYVDYW
nr:immunoglobulin heavy chain junction region [Mus musculus]MBK4185186.1 immunoglobulin heavy chain junction region [Mus musculus]